MAEKKKIVDIARNKKAYFEYEILDTIEAWIALKGTEIKSVRDHSVNLKDCFVLIRNRQASIHNMHISPYGFGNIFNHEPERVRSLLLHKKEILKLEQIVSQKGVTLIPTSLYLKGKFAKLAIGIAKGKQLHNKKDAIKEKDIKRDTDREMKNYR